MNPQSLHVPVVTGEAVSVVCSDYDDYTGHSFF